MKATLSDRTRILPLSSDAFFRAAATECLDPPPDLVFIDGMHLFEFVLRDFIHVERHAHPATLIVIDDIYPCHPTQAARRDGVASVDPVVGFCSNGCAKRGTKLGA